MAGQNVIAAMRAMSAETNANIEKKAAETYAKVAETNAKIDGYGVRLRALTWIVGLLVALVGMILAVLVAVVLYALSDGSAPVEASVATAVAEEPEDSESPAATDPEDAREVAQPGGPQ